MDESTVLLRPQCYRCILPARRDDSYLSPQGAEPHGACRLATPRKLFEEIVPMGSGFWIRISRNRLTYILPPTSGYPEDAARSD
jgi:hypothetical protein